MSVKVWQDEWGSWQVRKLQKQNRTGTHPTLLPYLSNCHGMRTTEKHRHFQLCCWYYYSWDSSCSYIIISLIIPAFLLFSFLWHPRWSWIAYLLKHRQWQRKFKSNYMGREKKRGWNRKGEKALKGWHWKENSWQQLTMFCTARPRITCCRKMTASSFSCSSWEVWEKQFFLNLLIVASNLCMSSFLKFNVKKK